jgi:hypothetical protein
MTMNPNHNGVRKPFWHEYVPDPGPYLASTAAEYAKDLDDYSELLSRHKERIAELSQEERVMLGQLFGAALELIGWLMVWMAMPGSIPEGTGPGY